MIDNSTFLFVYISILYLTNNDQDLFLFIIVIFVIINIRGGDKDLLKCIMESNIYNKYLKKVLTIIN